MGEGYISLGSGKIGQSRSQCMRHWETSVFRNVFVILEAGCSLTIMTTQIKAQDSWQWNLGVQIYMCVCFPH